MTQGTLACPGITGFSALKPRASASERRMEQSPQRSLPTQLTLPHSSASYLGVPRERFILLIHLLHPLIIQWLESRTSPQHPDVGAQRRPPHPPTTSQDSIHLGPALRGSCREPGHCWPLLGVFMVVKLNLIRQVLSLGPHILPHVKVCQKSYSGFTVFPSKCPLPSDSVCPGLSWAISCIHDHFFVD